jgi:hypothetical protein
MTKPSKSVTPSALSVTEESLEPSGVVLTIGGELTSPRHQSSARV